MKSYNREIDVFKNLTPPHIYKDNVNFDKDGKLIGFPQLVSFAQNTKQAEILMKALGPNLRTLLKQSPGGVFSKNSAYKITLQLVSGFLF